jgi:glutathione S-transferase
MDLYFAPFACSMATRIAFYEAGAEARYIEVDTKAGRTLAGDDFLAVNPLGQVPVLRADGGWLLTENAAILQHVAERLPAAGLMPEDEQGRARLREWLGFVSTELHKAVFTPLLSAKAPEGAKAFAREQAGPRFDLLSRHLDGRAFLLDRFSVADAYLATVLNWMSAAGLDPAAWPKVRAWHRSTLQRPSVARAVQEERALYAAEQARHAAA